MDMETDVKELYLNDPNNYENCKKLVDKYGCGILLETCYLQTVSHDYYDKEDYPSGFYLSNYFCEEYASASEALLTAAADTCVTLDEILNDLASLPYYDDRYSYRTHLSQLHKFIVSKEQKKMKELKNQVKSLQAKLASQ